MTGPGAVQNPLDLYVRSSPSPQHALDIFKGEWRSRLPPPLDGCVAGAADLFHDPRVTWAIAQLGGVEGRSVLELGPLEGGHTYMLEQAGAASIVAVEANTHAYLRCLIVKELLGLQRARFLCGDFVEYLREGQRRFDVCLASGVLYHLPDPVELIQHVAAATDRVYIWTHYYDPAILDGDPRFAERFEPPRPAERAGFRYTAHRQRYLGAHDRPGFAGGAEATSVWLEREDLLACLHHFGLAAIDTGFDEPHHPGGPSLALVAARP